MPLRQQAPETSATNAGAIPINIEGSLSNGRVIVNNLTFPDSRVIATLDLYLEDKPTGSGSATIRISNVTQATTASISVTVASGLNYATSSPALAMTAGDTYKIDCTAVGSTNPGGIGRLIIR